MLWMETGLRTRCQSLWNSLISLKFMAFGNGRVSISVWWDPRGVSQNQQTALKMFIPIWGLPEQHHQKGGSLKCKERSPLHWTWMKAYSAEGGSSSLCFWTLKKHSVTNRKIYTMSQCCLLPGCVGTQIFQESHELLLEARSFCLAVEMLALHIHTASGMEDSGQSTFLACFPFKTVQK